MRDMLSFYGSELSEVLSRLRKREPVIRSTSDLVGIVIILTVIVPKTNRANLVFPSAMQGTISAAGATIAPCFFRYMMNVPKLTHLWG